MSPAVTPPRGLARSRWWAMVNRCTNPASADWPRYGGRGITVCSRWMTFEFFYLDIGDSPAAGMSIDRIDNNGNYEPRNVRWATGAEQRSNQTNSNAAKTRCSNGHPFSAENTYISTSISGIRRQCRACNRVTVARRKAAALTQKVAA